MSSSSAEVLVEFGGQRAAVVYTGDDAFCGRTFGGTFEEPNLALQTVVIQEGVTRIDDNAFSHCPNLASVTIAKTVLSIGKLAFQGCASLASADLPASTKSIGNDAFSGCTSLKCINLPPGLKSIEDNLFLGCTSLGSIGIPTTVTSIGKYAFYRCSSLTSIVIPPRVTSVKEWTFYECFGLVSVSLPTVLSVIEAYAFQNCTALTSITVPTQVQTIGLQAFCGCKSLSSITLPMSLATIGKRAFGECCRLDAMLKVCPQWPQVKILNKTNLPQAIDAKAAAWGEKGGRGGTYALWGYVGKSSRNPLGRAYDVAAILCTVEIAKSIMKVVAIVEKNQKSLSLGEGEVSKTDHADMLLENAEGPSVSIFVRLEITNAPSIGNKPGFVPPQLQPRALRLKEAARALQKSMFPKDGNFTMDSEIHRIIEHLFVPLARHHFAECVELSRGIVAEMRSEYDSVRKGHLLIYGDTLRQVRQEPTFAELQRRSNKLVNDCQELAEISQLQGGNRPFMQLANTVCGLYCGAVAVSKRYNTLLGQVASKTGASFISAPQKGLMRVCEKLGLEPAPRNWEPERVTDLVRGAIKVFTCLVLTFFVLVCALYYCCTVFEWPDLAAFHSCSWCLRSRFQSFLFSRLYFLRVALLNPPPLLLLFFNPHFKVRQLHHNAECPAPLVRPGRQRPLKNFWRNRWNLG
jgi:hypothetical protein